MPPRLMLRDCLVATLFGASVLPANRRERRAEGAVELTLRPRSGSAVEYVELLDRAGRENRPCDLLITPGGIRPLANEELDAMRAHIEGGGAIRGQDALLLIARLADAEAERDAARKEAAQLRVEMSVLRANALRAEDAVGAIRELGAPLRRINDEEDD
jgi:hypothetical protein